MKFSNIFTIASLVSISGVLAAPAPMPRVTPAPAVAVYTDGRGNRVNRVDGHRYKGDRVPIADVAGLQIGAGHVVAVRDMDANEAESIVQGMFNGGNGNGYYNNNCDDNDDSCDNSNYGNDNGDGSDISDAQDYISNAADELAQHSQNLRQSMNGQMPRPIQTYLSQQSSRIAQASRIVQGGVPAMTRSASSFVSLASAYQNAEASFSPTANRIIQQVDNGSYNSAGSFKAPTVLAFASVLGATFVWTAL